jgi:signal transduction histidine kinase
VPDTSSLPSADPGTPSDAATGWSREDTRAGIAEPYLDVSPAVPPGQDGARRRPGLLGPAWIMLWIIGLVAIVIFSRWAMIPLSLIWIVFAVLYSFRLPETGSALWLATAVTVTTAAAIGLAISRGAQPTDELAEIPLLAAMFGLLIWHGHRRLAAEADRADRNEQCARLMAAERNLLQDASHQLKTPITIALGHAELLARSLTGWQDRQDIQVVVTELGRLRRLSERLLLLAASQNQDFLLCEPLALEIFAAETLRRWQPTADRRWLLGRLDQATVCADRERLELAVDAMLENAGQHTSPGDEIRLSVLHDEQSRCARLIIEDGGSGIAPADMAHIFDRFVTGSARTGHRGTGLGLALAAAIARGHGGDIQVQSVQGEGSRFDLLLPVMAAKIVPGLSGVPGLRGIPDFGAAPDLGGMPDLDTAPTLDAAKGLGAVAAQDRTALPGQLG